MQHRDKIVLRKILSEIDMGETTIGRCYFRKIFKK